MKKLLEKGKLLKGGEKMDKKKSLDVLDECIKWLENASELEIRKMQKIFHDEKKNSSYDNNEIELLLPSKIEMNRVISQEKFAIKDMKIVPPVVTKHELKYVENEFNEAEVNEWEGFAA